MNTKELKKEIRQIILQYKPEPKDLLARDYINDINDRLVILFDHALAKQRKEIRKQTIEEMVKLSPELAEKLYWTKESIRNAKKMVKSK